MESVLLKTVNFRGGDGEQDATKNFTLRKFWGVCVCVQNECPRSVQGTDSDWKSVLIFFFYKEVLEIELRFSVFHGKHFTN